MPIAVNVDTRSSASRREAGVVEIGPSVAALAKNTAPTSSKAAAPSSAPIAPPRTA